VPRSLDCHQFRRWTVEAWAIARRTWELSLCRAASGTELISIKSPVSADPLCSPKTPLGVGPRWSCIGRQWAGCVCADYGVIASAGCAMGRPAHANLMQVGGQPVCDGWSIICA
jgi:hypothetical protein